MHGENNATKKILRMGRGVKVQRRDHEKSPGQCLRIRTNKRAKESLSEGAIPSLIIFISFLMMIIQAFHQSFKPLGVKVKIPLEVPNRGDMFFHLVENLFHKTSQMIGSKDSRAKESEPNLQCPLRIGTISKTGMYGSFPRNGVPKMKE